MNKSEKSADEIRKEFDEILNAYIPHKATKEEIVENFRKYLTKLYGDIPNIPAFEYVKTVIGYKFDNDEYLYQSSDVLMIIISLLFSPTYNVKPDKWNNKNVNYIWNCYNDDMEVDIITFRVPYSLSNNNYFSYSLEILLNYFQYKVVDIVGTKTDEYKQYTIIHYDFV